MPGAETPAQAAIQRLVVKLGGQWRQRTERDEETVERARAQFEPIATFLGMLDEALRNILPIGAFVTSDRPFLLEPTGKATCSYRMAVEGKNPEWLNFKVGNLIEFRDGEYPANRHDALFQHILRVAEAYFGPPSALTEVWGPPLDDR